MRGKSAMQITLRGITWDHTRGFDPMVATARAYAQAHPDVHIDWERRSLQAFADAPVEELAQRFDLLVIDHPHVGQVAQSRCLLSLDGVGHDDELADLMANTIGGSQASYVYDGHTWALAIDAAAQIAAYRPDRITTPPSQWEEVIELAAKGRVLWPIKPVDALMSFFTLCANRGTPCRTDTTGERLIDPDIGQQVLENMLRLARHMPRACLSMNPIETFEMLSSSNHFWYCPLAYGYTNYCREGYRATRLMCADIPAIGDAGPAGSTLGGTGLAISAHCRHADIAMDYAFFVARGDTQASLYFDAGGQPAHRRAWEDPRCDDIANGFFHRTRATMDRVYLRPRYDGYLDFQDRGGTILNECLGGLIDPRNAMRLLEEAYQSSLPRHSPSVRTTAR